MLGEDFAKKVDYDELGSIPVRRPEGQYRNMDFMNLETNGVLAVACGSFVSC